MKIRTRFVSNSSTASFIVRIKDDPFCKARWPGFMVKEEDIPKLEEYGFKKSNLFSPFNKIEPFPKAYEPGCISMKYYIDCNYDDVICFLVKNNIPFKASCHYDHKLMSYQKDDDYIFEAINYEFILNMYGEGFYENCDLKDLYPFRKIPKDEYLKIHEV